MPILAAIFAWMFKGAAFKAVFVPLQFTVSIALILLHVAVLGYFVYSIVFIYNKINYVLDIINNIPFSNEVLTIALQVLQSLGIMASFHDVFAIFSPYLIAFLVYKIALIIYHSAETTSNELFKVGVLTQQ